MDLYNRIQINNFPAIDAGTKDFIFDGNDETYIWFHGNPDEGSTITIDLGSVQTLYDIRVLSGTGVEGEGKGGTDYFSAKVEVSEDGQEFTEIGSTGGIEEAFLSFSPREVKVIRLTKSKSNGWVAIREVSINSLDVRIKGFQRNGDGNLSYLTDGNEDNFCRIVKPATDEEEAWICWDLKFEQEITSIKVVMGDDEGGDLMSGIVQVSNDGKQWTEVGTLAKTARNTIIDLRDKPENARYIRLTNQASTGWVAIREISINVLDENDPMVTTEGLTYVNDFGSSLYNVVDGDNDSLVWFDFNGKAGSYIQLDLRETTTINNVIFYQQKDGIHGDDYFRDFTIEYSVDGEHWFVLGEEHYLATDTNNLEVIIDLSGAPIQARYIRVKTNDFMEYGAIIREFNVNVNLG